MYYLQCDCGRSHPLTDSINCPFCHRFLLNKTDEYARKHIKRCRDYKTSFVKGKVPEIPDEEEDVPLFRKGCTNCGTSDCRGNDAGVCERWTPRDLDVCPHCHRRPQERYVNGVLVEIRCDRCRTVMTPYNMKDGSNLMREMWNTR